MKTIFVDCDDTLALYCDIAGDCEHKIHPYGSEDSPWVPNERLLRGLESHFRANPEDRLVVWSGGGHMYATSFVEKLFFSEGNILEEPELAVLVADKIQPYIQQLVKVGDIVIDDQPILSAGKHFYPLEWPDCVCGAPGPQPCGKKCLYPHISGTTEVYSYPLEWRRK